MHNNKLWLGFLTLITLVVVWFTWETVAKARDYFSFSQVTEVSEIHWTVFKSGEDHYQLNATYTFQANGQTIPKEQLMPKPIYPNPWAAEQAASKENTKKFKVWYAPQTPKRASLYKHFPMKEIISTILLWGLWLYFLWLGFYVKQFSNSNFK